MAKNIQYQSVTLVKEKAARIELGPITQLRSPRDCFLSIECIFQLEDSPQEKLVMLALNTKNEILGAFTVHIGTVNMSICSVKDIIQRAILSNASGIIIAHNHPSGNPAPSQEDRDITKKLSEACNIFDIALLDHVIVGEGGRYTSLAEKGML